MNLSAVDPAIWDWQAPLLSYYLLGVIDRISEVVYQEIPNDPKSKKPYVHFHHPLGDIVIAPYEIEGKTQWKFTPETLGTIEGLFEEMEDVSLKVPIRMISENDLYFKLKNLAQSISPLLVKKFYNTALWQIVLLALIVFLAGWISYFSKWFIFKIVKRFYLTKRWTNDVITLRVLRPVQTLTFGLLLLYGAHQLGLSDFLFAIIKTFSQLLIVIGIAWIMFALIDITISLLKIRSKRHGSEVDEIFLSIVSSILRIGIILGAIFALAEIFGIPYKTVIAGLGIGGLAFAIAAKDTIANFFGSAIIIADRPFKTGDKIKIGSDIGVITNVGIRSTKIRTIYDTILTVPNNKITQEMIDNYSEREAMRVDTEFFLSLDTNKEALDGLDSAMTTFLKKHLSVDANKIILTGVHEYTKRGIEFSLSFFVKASNDMEYSDIRHRIVTDLAQIIKDNGIELVMIKQDYTDDKE
jgi:small-conductance mechanosensitive channel